MNLKIIMSERKVKNEKMKFNTYSDIIQNNKKWWSRYDLENLLNYLLNLKKIRIAIFLSFKCISIIKYNDRVLFISALTSSRSNSILITPVSLCSSNSSQMNLKWLWIAFKLILNISSVASSIHYKYKILNTLFCLTKLKEFVFILNILHKIDCI